MTSQWEIKKLGDIAQVKKGQMITSSIAKKGTIPVIAGGKKPAYFNDKANRLGKTITISASGANAGFVNFFNTPIFASDCSTIIENEQYSIEFLYFQLLRQQAKIFKAQTGGAQPHIHTKDIEPLEIPVPPLEEQRRIATVLSDIDALIEAQEKLIAKKKDIKTATMQQLLTGKTRLPGFNGAWETKKLGEVAEIVMGQSPSSSHYNTKRLGIPLIQGNADIKNRKTIKRIFTTEITKRGKSGDILMSVRAPVGEVSLATFDVCLGRGVCAIRYTNDYLYHYLISQESNWIRLSKGSTFDSVNSADVQALGICLPSSKNEQIAIATVLSDIDAELDSLTVELGKYQQIKEGAMQELLTGKTRLM